MKRILSIDGGGIRGVFPAAFLATIEELIGAPVVQFFDLIAGTSTGGIIALGLGLGYSAAEILGLYEEHGPAIFRGSRLGAVGRFAHGLFRPRYNREPLEATLRAYFGERRLGESQSRLVIPSMNLETGTVHIYKTSHNARFELDYRVSAVEVALATASAPVYFPAYRSEAGTPLVDGGVWANNPTAMAVVEAIGVLKWLPEEIHVLSLGCTTPPFSMGRIRLDALGLGRWSRKIIDLFMAAQSSASLGTAAVLLSHGRVHRVSPYVANSRFALDSVSEIPALRGLGVSEARSQLQFLRPRFLTQPAERFEPCHQLPGTAPIPQTASGPEVAAADSE